jgi:hypothetical protein
MQFFPKLQSELSTYVGHDLLRYTMKTNDSRNVQLCQLRSGIRCLDGYEMGNLGQSVYDNPDRIISFLSPW